MKTTCGTCRHYTTEALGAQQGVCRHGPPTAILMPMPGGRGMAVTGHFPPTATNAPGCGVWAAKAKAFEIDLSKLKLQEGDAA